MGQARSQEKHVLGLPGMLAAFDESQGVLVLAKRCCNHSAAIIGIGQCRRLQVRHGGEQDGRVVAPFLLGGCASPTDAWPDSTDGGARRAPFPAPDSRWAARTRGVAAMSAPVHCSRVHPRRLSPSWRAPVSAGTAVSCPRRNVSWRISRYGLAVIRSVFRPVLLRLRPIQVRSLSSALAPMGIGVRSTSTHSQCSWNR
jgi:hypothetical protein